MTHEPAETVVRQLVWAVGEGRWIAQHPFGTEQIVRDLRASSESTHGWFNQGRWIWFGSLADAKAAAQADYERRILEAIDLSALDTAKAEIERLRHDNEMLTTGGIIEVAVRNPSVADYMRHWEGRAENAESALTAAQERRAVLEERLGTLHSFVSVMIGRGPECAIPEDVPSPLGIPLRIGNLMREIDATLSPAVKEPK